MLFTSFAYLLYYGRAFAGGDAKLLIALGAVLPFSSLQDYLIIGAGFVFLLFVVGAVWGLSWTVYAVMHHPAGFRAAFKHELRNMRLIVLVCVFLGIASGGFSIWYNLAYLIFSLPILLLPVLYAYARAVESACFIRLLPASALREGDWLKNDVVLGKRVIRASVHGLSMEEIRLLRRVRKKVLIKEGIPFSPAFLFAFVLMVFFLLNSGLLQYFSPLAFLFWAGTLF